MSRVELSALPKEAKARKKGREYHIEITGRVSSVREIILGGRR